MKHPIIRTILLLVPLLIFTVACNGQPTAIATLAATAAGPDETQSSDESSISPDEATLVPEEASPATDDVASDMTAVAATEVAYAAVVAAPETPTPAPTPTVAATPTPAAPVAYTYRVINTYPHDPDAFTQGLDFDGDRLFEGTGRWGESSLREVGLESGTVLRSRPLDAQYFGEGITILNDKVFQLTWQEQTGFVYNRDTFEPLQTFTYPHEGWGITHDGTRLIVSDGTSTIRFWDADTLQEIGSITVRDHEGPVNRLNELEYVNGEIWANIWLTDLIARISPETGDVLGYIDLTNLLDTSALAQPADVLNGIAVNDAGRVFVTGKLWPSLFEIEVIEE
jgi:glutamine cyclotransferase